MAYRLEFVRRWLECTQRGDKARLLRERNIDKSTARHWLRAYERGDYTDAVVAASERSRNRVSNRERAELARLRTENEALRKKVAQAEAVQDIMGKAYELLQGISESPTDEHLMIPPSLMGADEYARWLARHTLS